MASLKELEQAFIKADDAAQKGDAQAKEDAAMFAAEIKSMRAAGGAVKHDWSELPGNIGPSALNLGTDYLHALNPLNYPETISTALRLGSGAIAKIPGVQGINDLAENAGIAAPRDRAAEQQDMELVNSAGEAIYDRYGTLENLKNTIITDPVGAGFDAGTVLTLGAGAAGRGPMVASKVAKLPRIAGQTRLSEALLRRMAPKDPAALNRLGDEAMVLDASPSMTGLAQGVVAKPGPNADALVEALVKRQEGRSDRLLHGTQNTLGRLRDPTALKKTIDKAGQRAAAPHYRQAKQNPPEFRSPILNDLIARQMTDPAKGMTTSNRAKNLEWLNKIDDAMLADNPQDAVARLHDLRKELDTYTKYDPMASSADKAAREVAQNARNVVDDILKNRVPGFMEGDKIISTSKKAQEAVDFGYDALEGGKSAMFPETFAKEYAKRDPRFVEEGVKGRLANVMGTSANDTAALRRAIGDGNDFNRRKLVKTFGQAKTDEIVKAVEREQAFGQNYADIARNSQTARRLEAQKLVEGPDAPRISDSATITGLVGRGAAKGINALIGKTVTKYSTRNADALAKALALKGADARKLLAELARKRTGGGKLRSIVRAVIAAHAAQTVQQPYR